MTARSDAHALHTILSTLREELSKQALQTTWAEVLDADFGSLTFARRHSEVVGLFASVAAQIEVMPDRSRERYQRHAYSWWNGVMSPVHPWNNAINPDTLIDQNALDQLDSAAELIEVRMEGSLKVTDSDATVGLVESCREWLKAIDGDQDIPPGLRLSLRHDLGHVIWLIENAHLFGLARVAAAGQIVVGNLATTSLVMPPAKRGVWMERAKNFVRALVTFSALLQGVDVGLGLAPGAASIFGELTEGPPATPSAPGLPGSVGPTEV